MIFYIDHVKNKRVHRVLNLPVINISLYSCNNYIIRHSYMYK